MIVLGLTGSIGMGKTTAAGILRNLGLPVHDADVAVHELLSSGGEAVPFVAAAFPEAWKESAKKLDRHKLGIIVFSDPRKRDYLEKILHPLVRRRQKRFLMAAHARGSRIAVLDVPLLFETGVYKSCDYTVCVTAPYFLQRQRVLTRPGMSEEKFRARLRSQLPDIEKRRMADFVVHSGLGKAYSYRQLKNIINRITEEEKTACAK